MIDFAHKVSTASTPAASTPTASTSAPFSDLERLGDEIAELAGHIDAATYRLLVLIREFDQREGWGVGFKTCAHWLNWRIGIAMGPAREKVHVARALSPAPVQLLVGDGAEPRRQLWQGRGRAGEPCGLGVSSVAGQQVRAGGQGLSPVEIGAAAAACPDHLAVQRVHCGGHSVLLRQLPRHQTDDSGVVAGATR